MAKKTGRVVVSQNAKKKLELARAIFTKHITEGGSSPLLQLQDAEIGLISSKIEPALALHEAAENLKLQTEKAYQQRDVAVDEIMELTSRCIKLLKTVYAKYPKKLADWGINIDDSPQPKKKNTGDTPSK
jgi:hypothetical protein